MWNSFQNDLAYTCITEEEISTYADDHQIFASGSSTTIAKVKVVRSLYGTRKTCYKIVQKYQSMVLGAESEANNINLPIDGVNIEQLKSIKLFGVFLGSELNFSKHISYVCKKASQQIGILRRLRKLIPTHAKLQLYKAAILPHLTYCSTIWHSAEPQTNVKLKDYRREPLECFSTTSQSPMTNC